jgi:hypothetical protein
MLKKICTFILLFVACFGFVGCGELSFEETPYGESPKTVGEIVSLYGEAQAGNIQLKAIYEGSITKNYGTTKKVNKLKYTIGKYGNNNYCIVEDTLSVNDVDLEIVKSVYYNNTKYTTRINIAGSQTTKTRQYFLTENINRDLIYSLFPVMYEDSIELTGHKQYNEENYYKLVLKKDCVNDEFVNPVIVKPTEVSGEAYFYNYAYEFGINKDGYLSYFVNEYSLIDSTFLTTNEPILTCISTFKITRPYGSNMFIDEPPPADSEFEPI